MLVSNTCSAVTRTERALTASKGTDSVLASGRITPWPMKRTCGLVLVNASSKVRSPDSVTAARLRSAVLQRQRHLARHVLVHVERQHVVLDARW